MVSVSQQAFGDLVAQVVARLYDIAFLQTHPLGRLLLGEASREGRGRALQRVVLEAVQALRPPTDAAANPRIWRSYRYLSLRYVQAVSASDVARELGISSRQASRTYREAIDALASVLWEHLRRQVEPNDIEPVEKGFLSTLAFEQEMNDLAPSAGLPAFVGRLPCSLCSGPDLDQELSHLSTGDKDDVTRLSDVIDGLRSIIGPLSLRYSCLWSVTVSSKLPALCCDRAVLRQLLLNLFCMAFESGFSQAHLREEQGQSQVQITLDCVPARSRSSATGNTMPTLNEDRLAVGSRLTEALGGTFQVRLKESGALTIVVSLPSVKPATVLVVDDNPDVVSTFRRYLDSAGVRVVSTHRGSDALHLALQSQPSAITLDVMMSSQDGWETLQILKNHPATQSIPVLICSVLREEELARFLGAAELLPKPVTRSQLLAALQRCGLSALNLLSPREHQSRL